MLHFRPYCLYNSFLYRYFRCFHCCFRIFQCISRKSQLTRLISYYIFSIVDFNINFRHRGVILCLLQCFLCYL